MSVTPPGELQRAELGKFAERRQFALYDFERSPSKRVTRNFRSPGGPVTVVTTIWVTGSVVVSEEPSGFPHCPLPHRYRYT